MERRPVVPEITLGEESGRRRTGEPGAGKQMSRAELEVLVGRKVDEAELARRVGRLEAENAALKQRTAELGGQLDTLAEVAGRVRQLETEGRGLRVPRVTRSVGLQVGPRPGGLALAPPAVNSEEIVLDSDEEEGEGGEEGEGEELLQLVVRRAAGGGSGVVVQWARRPAATLDLALVRGYELEGRQGAGRAWSRVGPAIRPLPLPMACNLNGFKQGIGYSFRIKMIHANLGTLFSNISTIDL